MEIGLADVIDSLRRELLELDRRATEKIFLLGDVELEMKFVVEKQAEAGGKGHYLFLAAEAKGSYKSANIHTIKLKLEPNKSWREGGEGSSMHGGGGLPERLAPSPPGPRD